MSDIRDAEPGTTWAQPERAQSEREAILAIVREVAFGWANEAELTTDEMTTVAAACDEIIRRVEGRA